MTSIEFFYKSRQDLKFENVLPLSSGNNMYPTLSVYDQLLTTSSLNDFKMNDYQEAGGDIFTRTYISSVINLEHNTDYYDWSNLFISMGTTDAIDVITLYAKMKLNCSHAYYILPCYYLFIQSAINYGYKLHFSPQINDVYNEHFLEMLEKAPLNSLVYLNNPNSLSGVALSDEFIKNLFSVVKKRKHYCIFDEITAKASLNNKIYSVLKIAIQEDCLDRIFITCSLSKEISLPGIRAGYLLTPRYIGPNIEHFFRQRYGAIPTFISYFVSSYFKIQNALRQNEDEKIGNRFIFNKGMRDLYMKEKDTYISLCNDNISYLLEQKKSYGFNFLYPDYGQSLFISKPIKKINYWKYIEECVNNYGIDVSFGPYFGGTLDCWTHYDNIYARINFSNSKANFRNVVSKFLDFLNTIE